MRKKALIFYSGGKDSHLALFYALKRGFDPILFHLDGGCKHREFFSNYIGGDIIKKHCDMMRLEVNSIKIKKLEFAKIFHKITDEALKKLKEGEKLFYFSSNDYNEQPKDEKINREFMKICMMKKINFVSFLDIISRDEVLAPVKLCLKNRIKSIIVGLEREIDKEWLLKFVDADFIKMIRKLLKAGDHIDANSYQSLVIESPLFGKKKLKILKTGYSYDPKERIHFSIIKNCSITSV